MAKVVRITYLVLFLCVILASTMFLKAQASIGVSEGSTFQYDFKATSSDSSAVPDSLTGIKLISVTITGVSDPIISSEIITHYENGSKISAIGTCNVETGEVVGLPFIGGNLQENDFVNPSAEGGLYVNETIARNYKDSSRETNHLKLEYHDTAEDGGVLDRTYEYYFDKSTGVLVEYSTQITFGGTTTNTQSKLIASNVWVVSSEPIQSDNSNAPSDGTSTLYIAITAIGIIIAVIAVIVLLRKRRRSEKSEVETDTVDAENED